MFWKTRKQGVLATRIDGDRNSDIHTLSGRKFLKIYTSEVAYGKGPDTKLGEILLKFIKKLETQSIRLKF